MYLYENVIFGMDRIKKIVSEEIQRFLIREGVEQLGQYSNQLYQLAQGFVNMIDRLQDQNISYEVNKTVIEYVFQIYHAINRCVTSKSLLEWNVLNTAGINIPPELGGNVWNHMQRGFYNWRNAANGGYASKGGINGRYGQNVLKSEKLSVLLQDLKNREQSWQQLCLKYQKLSQNQNILDQATDIFSKIGEVAQTYQMLASQQGQNTP